MQLWEPHHPWLHDPAPRPSHPPAESDIRGLRFVGANRRPDRSSSRWPLNQGISIFGRRDRPALRKVDFARLDQRADDQSKRVEARRIEAARDAFLPAKSGG